MSPFWKEEWAEALRRLLAGGLSHALAASALNDEFGTVFTRNACIGKSRRMGIRSLITPNRSLIPQQERRQIRNDRRRDERHALRPWLSVLYPNHGRSKAARARDTERRAALLEQQAAKLEQQKENRDLMLRYGAAKTSPAYRKHLPKVADMTRAELRAMLTAAVENTAAMEVL